MLSSSFHPTEEDPSAMHDPLRSEPNPMFETPDASRWSAVLHRSREHDGAFVYAVRSTGVYCRPSCPSRRPRRAQVRFFATPDEAEQAGFRACRRCAPRSVTRGEERVAEAVRFLERHADERVTLAALAREVGASPWHLQRSFRRALGLSPKAWLDAHRLERFKQRLRAGEGVSLASYEAGFGSSRGAYALAAKRLGMTPAVYRRGGRGERIRYTIVPCPLGLLLVAATARGVCAAAPGADGVTLEAGLSREFPQAERVRDRSGRGALARWARALVREMETGRPAGRLPLDLGGTEFQRRVWRALKEIPYGETRTYGRIAHTLGRPSAARAVASACAGNPVAVAVPCHRAVPARGGSGGYRWGRERKRRLIELERARRTSRA